MPHVLVIDDDKTLAEMLTEYLGNEGFKTTAGIRRHGRRLRRQWNVFGGWAFIKVGEFRKRQIASEWLCFCFHNKVLHNLAQALRIKWLLEVGARARRFEFTFIEFHKTAPN